MGRRDNLCQSYLRAYRATFEGAGEVTRGHFVLLVGLRLAEYPCTRGGIVNAINRLLKVPESFKPT